MTTSPTHAGRFFLDRVTGRAHWSETMYVIHGMNPGDVVPTRDVLLAHARPDDRALVAETLDAADVGGCEYRLAGLDGREHQVTLATSVDGAGLVTGVVLDLTGGRDAAVADRVNEQLTSALAAHAVIDQAKGVLMLTYGIDEAAAFTLLRSSSQEHNVRLRTLADRVLASAADGLGSAERERVDERLCAALQGASPPPTSPERHGFRAQLGMQNGIPALRLSGRADLANREELSAALGQVTARGRATGRALVDVRDTSRIDPAAAELLASCLRRCRAHGVAMTILGGGHDTGQGLDTVPSARVRGAAARP